MCNSGAYTAVREHFEAICNAAIGQKMGVFKAILDIFEELIGRRTLHGFAEFF